MIKAILIDVAAKTVTQVLIEKNLDAYYNALDCDVFTLFPLDEKMMFIVMMRVYIKERIFSLLRVVINQLGVMV